MVTGKSATCVRGWILLNSELVTFWYYFYWIKKQESLVVSRVLGWETDLPQCWLPCPLLTLSRKGSAQPHLGGSPGVLVRKLY